MTDTKEKILDTAERLIGEQGYSATSLRHIIAQARVNLAAVHYHFGSKEDLLDAVVARKATPVNDARLAWRFGIGPSITDPGIKLAELRNWLDKQVLR